MTQVARSTLNLIRAHHSVLLTQCTQVFGEYPGLLLVIDVALRHPVKMPRRAELEAEPEFRPFRGGEYA